MTKKLLLDNFFIGCGTSGLSSGIVFTTYFTIYNNIISNNNPLIANMAGLIAGFITSLLKIPIGNTMRLLHTGNVNNIFSDIPNNDMMYDNNLKLICNDDNSNLMVFCDCLNMALENVINNFEKDFDESREEVESSENDLQESEEASMCIAQLVNKV